MNSSENTSLFPIPAAAPPAAIRISHPPAARLKRVRCSWFVLGSLCGMALTAGASALLKTYSPPLATAPAVQQAVPSTQPTEENAAKPAKQSNAEIPNLGLPASMSLRVGKGDTLVEMLTDTGISYEQAQAAVGALRKIYDPRRLDVGQQLALSLDPSKTDPQEPVLSRLSLPVSKTTVVELQRGGNGEFSARKIEAPVFKKLVRLSGSITDSFYETGLRAGIPADALSDLIKVYSYDVDFQRDIKRGNRITVLMERMETKSGIVAAYGNVQYAALDLGKRTISVYRFTDRSGNVDYYNEKGESLRKALLRTPINGARITSGFGMRLHPLLGYSRMHRGVDFGAAAGTPIYAAGDGTVIYAGWHNGYGNYVQIKHNDKYATAYGHASRIASGIRPGTRVKQGQVVAFVGATGMATGPHLHYEVLVNGQQVNPAGVKFKTGNVLGGRELMAFKGQIRATQIALAESSDSKKLADTR
ncbi:MAG: peptidoglycan DD-metalloendopeptidase family protein [Alphaproteobacteria bacterium]|nr:peptidoglycan DD-metalloendopeptidase family protein [Alphaproteobacteria bacterium]